MLERSRVITRFPATGSGTNPREICCASPSAIAVLPTPGSPIRQGLFFPLLLKIWMTRRISSSLPITGSSFPSVASFVKSREYWSSTGVASKFLFLPLEDFSSSLEKLPSSPMATNKSTYNFCKFMLNVFNSRTAADSFSFITANKRCSVPTSSLLKCSASFSAVSNTFWVLGEYPSASSRIALSPGEISSSINSNSFFSSRWFSAKTLAATPVPSCNRPAKICSVPI